MDILGALKKLMQIGQFQHPTSQQPRQDIQYTNGQPVPKQVTPYPSMPNLKVGTADKQYQPVHPMYAPSNLNALLPQNAPNAKYRIYSGPGGDTLENDNASPDDPSAVQPYHPAPLLPDQPIFAPRTDIANAIPQYRRPRPRDYRSRSV